MSTSLLYHAFGLKGIHYEATRYFGDSVLLSARMNEKFVKCPKCKGRRVTFKGQKRRLLRMGLMGRKRCFLDLLLHRCKCRECAHLWWPTLPFMDGKHRYVRSFALSVIDMLKFATIEATAHWFRVGWDLVKQIHKEKLSHLYRTIDLDKVKYIGVDEFSIKKGHQYMSVFTDLRTGRILHAVEGRSKEDIRPFLEKLSRRAKNLEAISMDMSGSFYSAVRQWLP